MSNVNQKPTKAHASTPLARSGVGRWALGLALASPACSIDDLGITGEAPSSTTDPTTGLTTDPTTGPTTDPTTGPTTDPTTGPTTGGTEPVEPGTTTDAHESASTTTVGDETTGSDETTGTTGGDGTAGTTTGVGAPPEAAVLKLSFSAIKQFDFSWGAAPGADYYQVREDPTGKGNYEQIGNNIDGVGLSWTMPMHLRRHASYKLSACNENGCTDSAPVSVLSAMAEAVGYVKASNTDAEDAFGFSVALSADGGTLAVGAPFEDSKAKGINFDQSDDSADAAGAVYVFKRTDTTWVLQAYVKASNTSAGAQFGTSVALSQDGNTLAVGAYWEASKATGVNGIQTDQSVPYAGAAYVFTRGENAIWSQQAYIKASNTGSGDFFGENLALSGDGNTLAVGAAFEDSKAMNVNGYQLDNSAADSGAVYVYRRVNSDWGSTPIYYIKASNTGADDRFGGGLALSYDGNTLAVGAHREDSKAKGIQGDQSDNSAVDAGAVYVYKFINSNWWHQDYIKASNTDPYDYFGWKVALSGDGAILAVGAHGENSNNKDAMDDNSTDYAGAVYVFESGLKWEQQDYLKAPNPGKFDKLGFSVALSPNGDILAAGALWEDGQALGVGDASGDNGTENAGAVYVYEREGAKWPYQAYVKASNAGVGDWFGGNVALSDHVVDPLPDLGYTYTLAVGAYHEGSSANMIGGDQADEFASKAGAVYLY